MEVWVKFERILVSHASRSGMVSAFLNVAEAPMHGSVSGFTLAGGEFKAQLEVLLSLVQLQPVLCRNTTDRIMSEVVVRMLLQ